MCGHEPRVLPLQPAAASHGLCRFLSRRAASALCKPCSQRSIRGVWVLKILSSVSPTLQTKKRCTICTTFHAPSHNVPSPLASSGGGGGNAAALPGARAAAWRTPPAVGAHGGGLAASSCGSSVTCSLRIAKCTVQHLCVRHSDCHNRRGTDGSGMFICAVSPVLSRIRGRSTCKLRYAWRLRVGL